MRCYVRGVSTANDHPSNLADAYLADLGLDRQPPSLPALTEMVRRHVDRYPFASIGPRLRDDLPIDPPSLLDRIVVRGRGGYCFEQNGLLFAVLDQLGYPVRLQMARVLLSGNPHPGLTHRVTRAMVDDDEYLVDVGFGPQGPPFPVRMDGTESADGRYRVERTGDVDFRLETRDGDAWIALYRFDDVPYGQADAELGHFYSHRHPEAAFVNALVASRILDDEVRSLRNREYHVIQREDRTITTVEDAAHLHRILTEDIGLHVTVTESARLFEDTTP